LKKQENELKFKVDNQMKMEKKQINALYTKVSFLENEKNKYDQLFEKSVNLNTMYSSIIDMCKDNVLTNEEYLNVKPLTKGIELFVVQ